MEPVVVYNPADEPLLFVYGAEDFALPPNSFVVLNGLDAGGAPITARLPEDYCTISHLAKVLPEALRIKAHLQNTQAARGVVGVEDISEKGLQEAFTHAEQRHREWLRSTLTPVLVRDNTAKEKAVSAGLAHISSDEALRATLLAKEWELLAPEAPSK